jgi:hypothetical protein
VLIKKVRYVAILYEDNGGLRPSIMSADKEAARLSYPRRSRTNRFRWILIGRRKLPLSSV